MAQLPLAENVIKFKRTSPMLGCKRTTEYELRTNREAKTLYACYLVMRCNCLTIRCRSSFPSVLQTGVKREGGADLWPPPPPQTPGVQLALFADDTCMYATERRRDMFSESCNEAWLQWRRGVRAGTWRSVRISLRPSTSLTDVHRSGLILHWKDGKLPL